MYAPAHPIDQLTNAELADYRARLEEALKTPMSATVETELRYRLDAVRQEQDRASRHHGRAQRDPADALEHYDPEGRKQS